MRRVVLAAAAVLLLAFAGPGAARAATLTDSGGQLSYVAAAGIANVVTLDEALPGIVVVQRRPDAGDVDPIRTVSGCTAFVAGTSYLCAGVKTVFVDAGNGNDVIDAGGAMFGTSGLTTASATLVGGDGGDILYGGAGDDTLRGAADNDQLYGGGGNDVVDGGDGNDVLDGGDGNDALTGDAGNDDLSGGDGNDALLGGDGDDALDGGAGADSYSGGAGFDSAEVAATATDPPAVSVTLDNLANDGAAGEGDNVAPDVEQITGSARSLRLVPGTVVLTGDAGANVLTARTGRALITGGPGADVLTGGPQDDTIDARDGFADRVACGAGNDVAIVDPLDTVAADCESVQVAPAGTPSGAALAAAPPAPVDDRPPTAAFAAPAGGAKLSPDAPIPVTVTATDDHGIAKVQFLAGDRIVCEVAAAPYTCGYRPDGDEVGPDTLVAIAIDTTGQTATTMRPIVVKRFTPHVTLTVGKRKGHSVPVSGKLALPATVTAAEGCSGTVALTVKLGKRTLATRSAKLTKKCRLATTVSVAGHAGVKLAFGGRYGGNDVLGTASAPSRNVRL